MSDERTTRINQCDKYQVVLIDARDYIVKFQDFAPNDKASMLAYISEAMKGNEVGVIKITKWKNNKPMPTNRTLVGRK